MIIFFGPAGSGKSLQGQILAARYGWAWFSSGQLIRESNDTELHELIKVGKLVSNEKVQQVISDVLSKVPDDKQVILDGFPRQLDQAKWMLAGGFLKKDSNDLVIVVDVPVDVLLKRLEGRGRSDDTPESIKERLRAYDEETTIIFDYFSKQGIKIIHVDGSGTVGSIHDKITEELNSCNLI